MALLLRWIGVLGLVVIASTLGLWLANNPGELQLDWMGYRITTAFWVVLLVVIVAVVVGLTALWLVLRVVFAFSLFGSRRNVNHQKQGIEALTRVVVALSLHDHNSAATYLKQSNRLLGEELPLNLLLQAHISSKKGDKAATLTALNTMQSSPETRLLALTSLGRIAQRDRDVPESLRYAKEAYTLRPAHLPTAMNYLGLLIKAHTFTEAFALLKALRWQRIISKDTYYHTLARVYVCHYQVTNEASLLEKAFEADPTFPPAYGYIAMEYQRGNPRRAWKLLTQAWKIAPHPELVELMVSHTENDSLALQMKRASRLAHYHPQHSESHIAIARVSMLCKQWEFARNHLKAVLSLAPQMRVFRLLATLEEQGFHDDAAAALWLNRLPMAQPDPTWHCSACGHVSHQWSAHCDTCDSFDTSTWGQSSHNSLNPSSDDIQDALSLLKTPHFESQQI